MRCHNLLLCALPLFLSGCFSEDPADKMPAEQANNPPPAQVCAQVRDGLDAMSEKNAIDYADDGTAVMKESLFMQMGAEGRDKIGQMLAYHAACAAKAGSASQRVVIRNDFGNVMLQRNFDTRVNPLSLFGS